MDRKRIDSVVDFAFGALLALMSAEMLTLLILSVSYGGNANAGEKLLAWSGMLAFAALFGWLSCMEFTGQARAWFYRKLGVK